MDKQVRVLGIGFVLNVHGVPVFIRVTTAYLLQNRFVTKL
jgi:hypothetical protein